MHDSNKLFFDPCKYAKPFFFLANNKSERINNESLFQMIGVQDIVRSSEFTGWKPFLEKVC